MLFFQITLKESKWRNEKNCFMRNCRLHTSGLDKRHQTYSKMFDQEALWEIAIWDMGSRWYDNIEWIKRKYIIRLD
jgi:hypothetical protein